MSDRDLVMGGKCVRCGREKEHEIVTPVFYYGGDRTKDGLHCDVCAVVYLQLELVHRTSEREAAYQLLLDTAGLVNAKGVTL